MKNKTTLQWKTGTNPASSYFNYKTDRGIFTIDVMNNDIYYEENSTFYNPLSPVFNRAYNEAFGVVKSSFGTGCNKKKLNSKGLKRIGFKRLKVSHGSPDYDGVHNFLLCDIWKHDRKENDWRCINTGWGQSYVYL